MKQAKFKLGDTVYFLHDNRLHHGTVSARFVPKYEGLVIYRVSGYKESFTEQQVFATRNDLINSLIENE